jgi:hypothetical protein
LTYFVSHKCGSKNRFEMINHNGYYKMALILYEMIEAGELIHVDYNFQFSKHLNLCFCSSPACELFIQHGVWSNLMVLSKALAQIVGRKFYNKFDIKQIGHLSSNEMTEYFSGLEVFNKKQTMGNCVYVYSHWMQMLISFEKEYKIGYRLQSIYQLREMKGFPINTGNEKHWNHHIWKKKSKFTIKKVLGSVMDQ